MIAGRFEITVDEVDELVEAVAMRCAARIAAMFGVDPDADRNGPYDPDIDHHAPPKFGEHEGGQR